VRRVSNCILHLVGFWIRLCQCFSNWVGLGCAMATCTGSMLSLPSTSYQPLRVRATTNKGRSLCSLKGRSCSLGGVSLPELAWKGVNKELVAAADARSHHKGSVRTTCVCSATTSGGEER
jgi:hypothetical protein